MERVLGPSFARHTLVAPVAPPPPAVLSQGASIALQLTARGYAPEQIATLRQVELVDVLWDLQAALTVLGAATVRQAITKAHERGLLT